MKVSKNIVLPKIQWYQMFTSGYFTGTDANMQVSLSAMWPSMLRVRVLNAEEMDNISLEVGVELEKETGDSALFGIKELNEFCKLISNIADAVAKNPDKAPVFLKSAA